MATEAAEQQSVAAALQADAQKDLDEALPELEGALKSLDSLNKNDIGEIRGYVNAPKAVEKTMSAVCIILKVWAPALRRECRAAMRRTVCGCGHPGGPRPPSHQR